LLPQIAQIFADFFFGKIIEARFNWLESYFGFELTKTFCGGLRDLREYNFFTKKKRQEKPTAPYPYC
jgi:hypothetical protein